MGGGGTSIMKLLLQTYTAGGAEARPTQTATDNNPAVGSRWTTEAIERRASYVGPVLEEILHEMQEHGRQNENLEISLSWDLLPAGS